MIKRMAWETFKNTGDINVYLELKQIEEIEKEIQGDTLKSLQQECKLDNSFDMKKTNK